MGWKTGFEPATPGITIRCSNQLSYIHHSSQTLQQSRRCGAPDRTRTCNRRLRRPVLYPVELRAHITTVAPDCRIPPHPAHQPGQTGRGRGIRTPDPLLPKQMRYQTALYPDEGPGVAPEVPTRPRIVGSCGLAVKRHVPIIGVRYPLVQGQKVRIQMRAP